MKTLLGILFVIATTNFAQAQGPGQECVSKAEMQVIASHFTQFRDLANADYCYDGSHRSNLISGIMFMRKTKFAPMERSPDELFSGHFASDWYNYFIGRIDEMEIDENCPKGVGAYVYAFGGKTMYVCTMLLTSNFTGLDRASVFMHEARHIDGYPHITCSHGPRAGLQGACDNRISDTGSYAVSVETYAQLSRYALDMHPAFKAYARSAAVTYAAETFDTPARVNSTSQFMVMTKDKKFHTVKADGSKKELGSSPALGKIVMRGQHMILFPEDKTLTARYVFARNEGELAQQAGDLASEYNEQTPEQRANLADIHISAQWSARVYMDKVRFACDPRSPSTSDQNLSGERALGLVYPEGYDRAAKTVQLITQSGKVFDIGCQGKNSFVKASSLSLDQAYKSLYKVGNLTLGLSSDGFLREIQGTSSRPYSVPGLDGNVFEIAPNQAVGFFNE